MGTLKLKKAHNRLIICGGQLLSAGSWLYGHAIIMHGKEIEAIVPLKDIQLYLPARVYEFPHDFFVLPGFIDLHVHGLQGRDIMDATTAAFQTISQALAKDGVTAFLATTMSASMAELSKILKSIAAFQGKEKGALVLGVHLEGPFIAPGKRGAQRDLGVLPDVSSIQDLLHTPTPLVKVITLAPELPGADALITFCQQQGIIVSIGHTNATFEETLQAITLGATHATHWMNAMSAIHQRSPGAAVALLMSNTVSAELIVDGHHLHPAIVDLIYRVKPKDKLLLITDSMRGKCLSAGAYDLGGQQVVVREDGKAILADGTLAGSVLSMPQAIINFMQATNCPLADAVAMASSNPARALGLNKKGSIEVDYDADIVVLNADFQVMLTIRQGKEIFP